jgi:hypothetical protein
MLGGLIHLEQLDLIFIKEIELNTLPELPALHTLDVYGSKIG